MLSWEIKTSSRAAVDVRHGLQASLCLFTRSDLPIPALYTSYRRSQEERTA
jgi:hypothetical protein